jgi:hypothetical protein
VTAAPPSNDPARNFAFALLGCAVLILVGTFNHSWLTAKGGDAGIGPLGAEVCMRGICRSIGWGMISGDIQLFGTLSLIGGIAAALAAAAYGGAFIADRRDKLPAVKVANIVFGLSAFATTFFLLRMLTDGKGLSISWGAFPSIGGIIVAGAMLKKLAPHLKSPPLQPLPPPQDSPPPPPLPPTVPMPPRS